MPPRQEINRKGQRKAPYCIKMLLTTDYGERAKGKPKGTQSPDSTPLHWPKPCEQFTHSTQRVQDSPFTNKRTPRRTLILQDSKGAGGQHHPTRPKDLGETRATFAAGVPLQ